MARIHYALAATALLGLTAGAAQAQTSPYATPMAPAPMAEPAAPMGAPMAPPAPGMGTPGMAAPMPRHRPMHPPGAAHGRPGMAHQGMASPGMASPGMASPGMASPGMASPGMASPGMPMGGANVMPAPAQPFNGLSLPSQQVGNGAYNGGGVVLEYMPDGTTRVVR